MADQCSKDSQPSKSQRTAVACCFHWPGLARIVWGGAQKRLFCLIAPQAGSMPLVNAMFEALLFLYTFGPFSLRVRVGEWTGV